MLTPEQRARALEAYCKRYNAHGATHEVLGSTISYRVWLDCWEVLATQQATQGKVADDAKRVEQLEEWLEWISRNIGQCEYLLMKGRTELDAAYAADCRKRGEEGITQVWAALLANGPKSLAATPPTTGEKGVVPDFVLVPREPTSEMRFAGGVRIVKEEENGTHCEWAARLVYVDMLAAAPSPSVGSQWISVKERLPEKGQEVLCAYQEHEIVTVGDQDVDKWTQKMFNGEGCDGFIECYAIAYGSRSYVTHWMSLPEPPTVSVSLTCNCGCGREARWLMTGEDFQGNPFVDDPACDSAARYCQEAAAELGRAFTMRPIAHDQ